MTKVNPHFYAELDARGLLKQVSDPEFEKRLSKESLTVYAGFDPTSDSLHVGNLLPLLTLRRFQLAGHRVIAVAGGATGRVGDPSGKSDERSLMPPHTLDHNVEGIKKVLSRFLDFNGTNPALLVNNADWFKNTFFLDFLRDIGKHFTVNYMLAKESVRARLEDRDQGISFTEFSYMLIQAYDFYHLHRTEKCNVQIGGSDQWGNITAGIELIRRKGEAAQVFGMTHPLIQKSDGTKFGKTEKGAIWLTSDKTTAYQFYQWALQTADADIVGLLKFFSFRSVADILELEKSVATRPEKREAQIEFARELTSMTHGAAELARVEAASQALFGEDIRSLDSNTLKEALSEAPSIEKNLSFIQSGYPLIDALVDTGLCASKGAARKDIAGGGISINNVRVTDIAATLKTEHLISGSIVTLRKGKKNYALIQFSSSPLPAK